MKNIDEGAFAAMKKKILVILLLIMICFCLVGCGTKVYKDKEKIIYDKFIALKKFDSIYLVYDSDTYVMYYVGNTATTSGISPYYVMGENGPEIGVYGVNYGM